VHEVDQRRKQIQHGEPGQPVPERLGEGSLGKASGRCRAKSVPPASPGARPRRPVGGGGPARDYRSGHYTKAR
jgi:hypothetical protein